MSKNLAHHGVKGMKWGVRNGANDDVVLARGTKLNNISKDAPRTTTGPIYTSHTAKDNAYYKGNYAQTLKMLLGAKAVYLNEYSAATTIKAPGLAKRQETFKQLYKDDPETMTRALAKTKVETSILLSIASKMNSGVTEKQVKKMSSLGEEALSSERMQLLMARSLTFDTPARSAYFDRLLKQGYNATVDDNDYSRGADAPLIIFNPAKTLKAKQTVSVSDAEMSVAIEEFSRLSK